MIVVTGAAGFIGGSLIARLNEENRSDLVLVDHSWNETKLHNIEGRRFRLRLNRSEFLEWLEANHDKVEVVFHLGARTNTIDNDVDLFNDLNFHGTQGVWKQCAKHGLRMIYASSAATYGLGELGFEDNHEVVPSLQPLNPYAKSKNDFDLWALGQRRAPPFWVGLKFFNVYGPNESHKARMASVIFHAFRQIQEHGRVKLFRSHHPDFQDGHQQRDFVYVKDVVDICLFLARKGQSSGLYNVGTGVARTFLDLAKKTFAALDKTVLIDWVETPEELRDRYQYRTCANMAKLRKAGYRKEFTTLERGIDEYVRHYLIPGKRY